MVKKMVKTSNPGISRNSRDPVWLSQAWRKPAGLHTGPGSPCPCSWLRLCPSSPHCTDHLEWVVQPPAGGQQTQIKGRAPCWGLRVGLRVGFNRGPGRDPTGQGGQEELKGWDLREDSWARAAHESCSMTGGKKAKEMNRHL